MGLFSWITSDTKRSIPNRWNNTFQVHMITRDGRVFTEDNYGGYGVFGGKDFYDLVAEMNGEEGRDSGIDIAFGVDYITNGERKYYERGRDFTSWGDVLEAEGHSPNDLLEMGWECVTEHAEGVQIPKFVEKLPSKKNWKKEFDALPNSDSCPDQGHFYEGIEL